MAAKTKSKPKTKHKPSQPRTHKPRRTSWQDDSGIGYATYDHEEDYVSPTTLDERQINLLRGFKTRLATAPILIDREP